MQISCPLGFDLRIVVRGGGGIPYLVIMKVQCRVTLVLERVYFYTSHVKIYVYILDIYIDIDTLKDILTKRNSKHTRKMFSQTETLLRLRVYIHFVFAHTCIYVGIHVIIRNSCARRVLYSAHTIRCESVLCESRRRRYYGRRHCRLRTDLFL